MSTTKKEFLSEYASQPELAEKVLAQGGVAWSEIKERGWDVYDAGSGAVPGLIYYKDTVRFAKKNILLILKAKAVFESECGILSNMPDPTDEDIFYNWLAWFAWENTLSEVLSFLGKD